jgi:hypothetical protein
VSFAKRKDGVREDTDRTYVGPNAWNLEPPNGQQRVCA